MEKKMKIEQIMEEIKSGFFGNIKKKKTQDSISKAEIITILDFFQDEFPSKEFLKKDMLLHLLNNALKKASIKKKSESIDTRKKQNKAKIWTRFACHLLNMRLDVDFADVYNEDNHCYNFSLEHLNHVAEMEEMEDTTIVSNHSPFRYSGDWKTSYNCGRGLLSFGFYAKLHKKVRKKGSAFCGYDSEERFVDFVPKDKKDDAGYLVSCGIVEVIEEKNLANVPNDGCSTKDWNSYFGMKQCNQNAKGDMSNFLERHGSVVFYRMNLLIRPFELDALETQINRHWNDTDFVSDETKVQEFIDKRDNILEKGLPFSIIQNHS